MLICSKMHVALISTVLSWPYTPCTAAEEVDVLQLPYRHSSAACQLQRGARQAALGPSNGVELAEFKTSKGC